MGVNYKFVYADGFVCEYVCVELYLVNDYGDLLVIPKEFPIKFHTPRLIGLRGTTGNLFLEPNIVAIYKNPLYG